MKMNIDTVMFRPHPVGKAGQLIQFFPPPPPSMLGFVSLLGGVVFVCCWLLLFRKVSSARYLRSLPVRALRAMQLGRGGLERGTFLFSPLDQFNPQTHFGQ